MHMGLIRPGEIKAAQPQPGVELKKKGLAPQNDTFLQAPNSSLLAVTANPITEKNNKTDIGGAVIGWQKMKGLLKII